MTRSVVCLGSSVLSPEEPLRADGEHEREQVDVTTIEYCVQQLFPIVGR